MNIMKLSSKDIIAHWKRIRFSIIAAIYPTASPDEDVIQQMQCRLLTGSMQCWCIYNEGKRIYGYVITSIESNMLDKYLFICSEYLESGLPTKDDFHSVSESLLRFAKANGCKRVVAYSKNPNAISIAKKLGYTAEFMILTKEI